jgi:hypothetical protein
MYITYICIIYVYTYICIYNILYVEHYAARAAARRHKRSSQRSSSVTAAHDVTPGGAPSGRHLDPPRGRIRGWVFYCCVETPSVPRVASS